jgi:hypothetical protein
VPALVTTIPVGPVYTAGGPAVAVNPLVTVIDVDSTNLSGATVSITIGLASGDTLSFTAPVGSTITGSYAPGTGTLTLSGVGTVAQYQQALQSVTFASSSSTLATIKTIEFVVTDDLNVASLPGLVAVTVLALPVNVPPLVATTGLGAVYTAGNTAMAVNPLVTVVDLDSTNLTGATAKITIGLASGDVLSFTAPVGSSITGSYVAATGTLTLSGTGTIAQYQQALQSVTFSSSPVALAAIKTVSFTVTDQQGAMSLPGLAAVTVLANLAPVVTTSLVGNLLYTKNSGPKVLDSLITVSDDSTLLTGATVSITLGLASDTLGFTQPSGSSITSSYNSGTGVLTLSGSGTVAQYQQALRSVTFATTSGTLVSLTRTISIAVTDQQNLSSLPSVVLITILGL